MSDVETQLDWHLDAVDDVLPVVAALVAADTPFALASITAADGGPRPAGSQMAVTADRYWGFLSGGCVEADVARQAREALLVGRSRCIAYGHGSPFFDIRLPCGGRIDLLIEPCRPEEPAILDLLEAARERRALRYLSDGTSRRAQAAEAPVEGHWLVNRLQEPMQRLVVVGSDPFALAIAAEGLHQGWEVTLVRPNGPMSPPPFAVKYLTEAPELAIVRLAPDPWTAIAIATHDADLDQDALLASLRSAAGYVGVLGSRRRLDARRARLLGSGVPEADLTRLRAPIGLPILARNPREIAVAVVAEIIERRPWPSPRVAPSARASVGVSAL